MCWALFQNSTACSTELVTVCLPVLLESVLTVCHKPTPSRVAAQLGTFAARGWPRVMLTLHGGFCCVDDKMIMHNETTRPRIHTSTQRVSVR